MSLIVSLTTAPVPDCIQQAQMKCLHTKSPVMTASSGCRKPFVTQRRRLDKKGSDATPRVASQAPHSADLHPFPPKKVSMVSLGCPKNTVDGEVMLGDLFRSGFDIVDDHEDADAIVVNTCSFVEEAKTESLEAIMQAAQSKADGKAQRVIVTGCLAQRYSEDLAEQLPEADMVMGFQNYNSLPRHLRGMLGLSPELDSATYSGASRTQVGEATVSFRPEYDRHRLTPKHTAYLRVAEGCNHACTFCAIPGFRGKFRSKPWQQLLEEAQYLVESGVKELNLIAEDTNQYGQDRRDGKGLAQLMHELSKLEGLQWMRILYAYPSYFTDDLIDEIATNPKVCKYIDIPLQHISNMTLLSMNRPPQEHTVKLLKKLRQRIPDLVLRTTFISGFPGETAESHEELVQFCRDFPFQRMGAFTYSEEDGTPAAEYQDQVPQDVREARRDELVELQQHVGQSFAESLVGQQVSVLVDSITEEGEFVGRTQWDAPDVDPMVFLSESDNNHAEPLAVGQMRLCQIDGALLFDVEAHPVC